jgi:cell wall-associated NlpC family hydrolase
MYNKIEDLIGKPYRLENEPSGEGKYDCWDIVVEVYKRYDLMLPSWKNCHSDAYISTKIEEEKGKLGDYWEEINPSNPSIPCIILFKQAGICNHVGVYIGNGMFIHSGEKSGVTVDRIDHILWKRRIEGYYTLKVKEG